MNEERIKQFTEQADWWKPLGLPSNWDEGDYVVSPEQMKKFAELIVRECAQIADEGYGSDHFGNGIAGYQLLKHFGVEE